MSFFLLLLLSLMLYSSRVHRTCAPDSEGSLAFPECNVSSQLFSSYVHVNFIFDIFIYSDIGL